MTAQSIPPAPFWADIRSSTSRRPPHASRSCDISRSASRSRPRTPRPDTLPV